ncbi:coiled-coil domain-containing protein 169 isoform X2 [Xenopus laevis]|uniref:Coiled-coil domain-containing protein 169 isoform X2 n=1 Tax=Xenopus laevis TaxID=8355 RepID=A0A8J1MGC4_XENLA|nr:coiled-coil domain-containing protein 169 isoform X2 [Xenopus laevis]
MENVGDGSAAAPVDSYRLTEEIQLEKNKKEMLQMSTFELKNTIAELEQRLNSVEDEDRLSSIRSLDQMPVGALNQFVKHLDDEKILLENQLKNFELRIEQEAKAYYKVNNERRMYISEIAQTSVTQEAAKKQQSDPAHATREKPAFKAKYNGPAKRRTMTKRRGEMTKGSHPSNMKH